MRVQFPAEFGEVRDGTGKSVQLVEDNQINQASLRVGHQLFQCRAIHVTAGESVIIVTLRQTDPAAAFLTGHICLPGFALGIDGIEIFFLAILHRFPAVDGASYLFLHYFTPKKSLPFQRVPVIFRATAESEA